MLLPLLRSQPRGRHIAGVAVEDEDEEEEEEEEEISNTNLLSQCHLLFGQIILPLVVDVSLVESSPTARDVDRGRKMPCITNIDRADVWSMSCD